MPLDLFSWTLIGLFGLVVGSAAGIVTVGGVAFLALIVFAS